MVGKDLCGQQNNSLKPQHDQLYVYKTQFLLIDPLFPVLLILSRNQKVIVRLCSTFVTALGSLASYSHDYKGMVSLEHADFLVRIDQHMEPLEKE